MLRLRYAFEMLMAYLAENMGDTDSMDNHIAAADKLWLEIWKREQTT